MANQRVRQLARRRVREAQAQALSDRRARERRWSDLGVAVVVALAERDQAVLAHERAAGEALRELTEDEGVTLREAVTWCGEGLSVREAGRLRGLSCGDDSSGDDGGAAETNQGETGGGGTLEG
ncbi:hypothetical protein [Ornithinimicrobium murale]|uniref:hypothetical protein n=1 Tax=Ornithinimicrobium murale TaxID=1050153 RepID=UPI0013B3D807|nr:hypothetical protein [Ornithinimicrobium murale]